MVVAVLIAGLISPKHVPATLFDEGGLQKLCYISTCEHVDNYCERYLKYECGSGTFMNVTQEIRAGEGMANIYEKITEGRLRWLGHVERKAEEDVANRTWKMEVVDTER